MGPPLGWMVHHTAGRAEQDRAAASFRVMVAEKAFRLEKEVLSLAEVLRSVRAFHKSSELVTRSEFESFVQGPLERLGAIRVIEWAPRVPRDQRRAHEAATRAEGFRDYVIREPATRGSPVAAGNRAAYYPVHYLEPHDANEKAFGLDLACEATRRDALERAAMTVDPVISDPIHLVQEDAPVAGFLMCQAVWDHRLDEPAGYVVLAATIPDLLCSAELVCESGPETLFHMRLDDLDGIEGPQPLHTDPGFESGAMAVARDILAAGQTWRLSAVPTAAFLSGRSSIQPLLLGLAAMALWATLVGFAGLGVRRLQERADAGRSRTIRSVLSALGEGVIVAAPDGTILFENEAARSILGQGRAQARPGSRAQTYGLFLPDAVTPYPEEDLPLNRTLRGERVKETEVFVRNARRPHGVWMSVSGSPLDARDGTRRGGVVVLRDVTERRRFQAQRIEMELAALVQQNLYPPHPPIVDGFDIAGDVESAAATCGDYYDFFPLIDGRTALVIGDVSGHGLGPALVMGQVRAYLRSIATTVAAPEEILERVNRLLTPDLKESLFVTLLIVCIDPETESISYASAGHTPGFILGSDGEVRAELVRTGIPLGVAVESRYHCCETASLRPGDTLLMMTDGVSESRSPGGRFLMEEGAVELVKEARSRPAAEVIEHLKAGVDSFRRGGKPDDDVTMIVVHRVGRPVPDDKLLAHELP